MQCCALEKASHNFQAAKELACVVMYPAAERNERPFRWASHDQGCPYKPAKQQRSQ
jgi:hypothetical protein